MTELKVRPRFRMPTPARTREAALSQRTWHLAFIAAALVLWAVALPGIDLGAMTGYGLISVLPPGYFAAIGLLCVGFAVGLNQRLAPGTLLCYPFALLVMLHVVVPLVFTEPRYSYVYKHIAVARYISEFGGIDRTVDIYNNWPGIFSATALLSEAAGVDPAAFANWADPVFAACGALAVRFVARSLTADARRVAVTVWLYVLASCGSQVYLAPQSLAFFLVLVATGITLRWLGPVPGSRARRAFLAVDRRVFAVSRRVLGRAQWLGRLRLLPTGPSGLPGPEPEATGAVSPGFAAGGVLVLAAAVVVTHQLSPFFMALGLFALVVTGRIRAWWLPVAIGLMMAFWIYLSYDYVSLHFTLFAFDPFENVKGTQAAIPAPGSPEFRTVGLAARLMTVIVVGAAVLSWWRAPLKRRETFVWAIAIAPAVVLLVQSYGGEAIYRVVMFILPWACYLASRAIAAPPRRWPRLRTAAVAVASAAVAGLFLLNYFGLDRVNNVQPQEVRASAWFETNAPPGSMLGYLNGYLPTPSTALYVDHLNVDGNWGGGIFSDSRFQGYAGRALTSADIPGILAIWREMSASGAVYVLIGPTSIAAVETYGYSPPGTIQDFVDALLADSGLRIVYQDADAYVLEVVADPPQ